MVNHIGRSNHGVDLVKPRLLKEDIPCLSAHAARAATVRATRTSKRGVQRHQNMLPSMPCATRQPPCPRLSGKGTLERSRLCSKAAGNKTQSGSNVLLRWETPSPLAFAHPPKRPAARLASATRYDEVRNALKTWQRHPGSAIACVPSRVARVVQNTLTVFWQRQQAAVHMHICSCCEATC